MNAPVSNGITPENEVDSLRQVVCAMLCGTINNVAILVSHSRSFCLAMTIVKVLKGKHD